MKEQSGEQRVRPGLIMPCEHYFYTHHTYGKYCPVAKEC